MSRGNGRRHRNGKANRGVRPIPSPEVSLWRLMHSDPSTDQQMTEPETW